MKHSVLAPDYQSAHNLARVVRGAGHDARVCTYQGHTIVLVHAPESVLVAACARAAFVPGLRTGYSS